MIVRFQRLTKVLENLCEDGYCFNEYFLLENLFGARQICSGVHLSLSVLLKQNIRDCGLRLKTRVERDII